MKLYVGVKEVLAETYSPICASPLYVPGRASIVRPREVLLDSGAFTDGMAGKPRLVPEAAAERQLLWEQKAQRVWGLDFRADLIVAYDALSRTAHDRKTIKRSQLETYRNNQWLDLHRGWFGRRTLIFPLQGNSVVSFASAARANVPLLRAGDWCGLGGWCTLGRRRTRLPLFLATLHEVFAVMGAYGVHSLHLFGILWYKALAGAARIARNYGCSLSTDSAAPARYVHWGVERSRGYSTEQSVLLARQRLDSL